MEFSFIVTEGTAKPVENTGLISCVVLEMGV